MNDYYRYAHMGITFIIVFFGFMYGGYWLDQKWQVAPLWTLVGAVLGFASGFYYLVQKTK